MIPLIIADAIGVSLDRDVEVRLRREDAGDSGESFASGAGETRAVNLDLACDAVFASESIREKTRETDAHDRDAARPDVRA